MHIKKQGRQPWDDRRKSSNKTVDNYWYLNIRNTNVCIKTSSKEERFDNVYELCISRKTKL